MEELDPVDTKTISKSEQFRSLNSFLESLFAESIYFISDICQYM